MSNKIEKLGKVIEMKSNKKMNSQTKEEQVVTSNLLSTREKDHMYNRR